MPMPSNPRFKKTVIGVTGGIGSGKSLACSYFRKSGFTVINADSVTKELYKSNKLLRKKLVNAFGKEIVNADGSISGPIARKKIFSSKKNIKRVNSIVHPFVIKKIDSMLVKLKDKIILIETAILFESGYYKKMDYAILIFTNKKLRLKRVKERDNVSTSSISKIMNLQMDERLKLKKTDFSICNNGSKKELQNGIKYIGRIIKHL